MDELTAPTPLRRYVKDVADLPIYGRVCMFTVNETALPHEVVKDGLDAVGLGAYAPRKPADVDVFRRVSTNAGVNRVPFPDGTYANVLIRDVSNDEERVLRRLVVELVDANDKRLDYSEAYDLIFLKDNGGLTYMPLTAAPLPVADEIIMQVRADYYAKRGTINGDGIRQILKTALGNHHAVTIRKSGGVFFVPAAEDRVLEALHKFARNHAEITLWSFPLVQEAGGNQGDMLAQAVTDEALAEAQELMAKLANGVSEKVLTGYLARWERLDGQLTVYREMLANQLDEATVSCESLRRALANASTNVLAAAA